MIGYVTVGTNDFKKALTFFDQLFEVVGEKRLWSTGSMAAWGPSRNEPAFCITKPYDKNSASVGNGMMVAFKVASKELVDAVHDKAIELGGKNEGDAGARGTGGFYGGYFRDLDGNKFNAYTPASTIG